MTDAVVSRRKLPHSVTAAIVFGWTGGAIAWLASSWWTEISSTIISYGRLDQLQMLCMGSCVGASVLIGRARHRCESTAFALLAGALLGGGLALVTATIAWWLPAPATPTGFVALRLMSWTLAGCFVSGALACYSRNIFARRVLESTLLGAIGGATSGAIFTLPGPAELWLPLAMTFFGASVGFAAVGPGLWRAPLVVQTLPARDSRRGLFTLNERAIDNGWSMTLLEARIACVDNRVYVYPAPGGVGIDGHAYYRPTQLKHDALLTVGRVRYRALMPNWKP